MAVQMRGATPKQLVPGLMGVLGQNYKAVEAEHQYIFETQTSSRSYEEEVMTSGFGLAAIKPEGGNFNYDTMEETWTARYTHETVALGFMITEEAVEDNLYENYANKGAKALGKSMAETKQIKAASVLNLAFTAGVNGGDGQPLCSTTHPTKAGSYSNRVSQDISEVSLEAATIAINKWQDERGLLIDVMPKSLHLPVESQFDIERILKSTLRPTVIVTNATASGAAGADGPATGRVGVTNSNEVNALKNLGFFDTIRIHRRFTDNDCWFIKTSVSDGLKHFVRRKATVKTDGDFQTGNSLMKMTERYSFGWSDPRQIYGSQGA